MISISPQNMLRDSLINTENFLLITQNQCFSFFFVTKLDAIALSLQQVQIDSIQSFYV